MIAMNEVVVTGPPRRQRDPSVRELIARRVLDAHFQPIVSLDGAAVCGHEAQARNLALYLLA